MFVVRFLTFDPQLLVLLHVATMSSLTDNACIIKLPTTYIMYQLLPAAQPAFPQIKKKPMCVIPDYSEEWVDYDTTTPVPDFSSFVVIE